uniref:F-actin-capping protein subunit alpha n=1 Tax=Parascaris equorum TaxID=6256 RepID=A0A914RAD9_PAREQ
MYTCMWRYVETLITPFNELPNGRFADPKSRKTFKYDHLRKEASDIQSENTSDINMELWRKALQEVLIFELTPENAFALSELIIGYVDFRNSHYLETGTATVFTYNDTVTLCIESHRYQPKNFWNMVPACSAPSL